MSENCNEMQFSVRNDYKLVQKNFFLGDTELVHTCSAHNNDKPRE
jgi:hypothetical protein